MDAIPFVLLADGRKVRRRTSVLSKDLLSQQSEIDVTFEIYDLSGTKSEIHDIFRVRHFFRYELEHLLARCGFEVICVNGGFRREPLTTHSKVMAVIAKKVMGF
jgi:hypothetical protein